MFKKKKKKRVKVDMSNKDIDKYIASVYFLYKVCEGCDNLVSYTTPICPKCNAYRFDDSYERIKEVTKEIIHTATNTLSCYHVTVI